MQVAAVHKMPDMAVNAKACHAKASGLQDETIRVYIVEKTVTQYQDIPVLLTNFLERRKWLLY